MVKAFGIAILGLFLLAVPAHAADVETRDFEVLRNGDPIGHHRVRIARDGDRTTVNIDIKLRVSLGGILTLYRYLHESEEIWDGDRLVSLKSTTDNDGTQEQLTATATADGLQVRGTRFSGLLPAGTMPTSYWRGDFARRAPIMDSQNGRLLDVDVRPEAVETASAVRGEIPDRRYRISGEIDLILWYDGDGRWVKSAFRADDGSSIDYRLK